MLSGSGTFAHAATADTGVGNAQCGTFNPFDSSMGTTFAGVRALRAGQLQSRSGGGGWLDIIDYVDSGLPDSDIGDQFEIRMIQTAGDTLTFSSGLNTWLAITTTRTWNYSDNPGEFKSFTGNWEVREIADTGNTSGTCAGTIDTEDGS